MKMFTRVIWRQQVVKGSSALSGLQSELSGLIQRIQQVQSGSTYSGSTYQYGTSGGYGGLPYNSTTGNSTGSNTR